MKNMTKHPIIFATLLSFAKATTCDQNYTLHILKLGGGLITDRDSTHGIAKRDAISAIAQQIARFLSKNPNHRVILVHGGGSFAHPIAKKHKLHLRFDQKNAHGVIEVHNGIKDLNRIFVQELNNVGILALPIHPMSCIRCSEGKIVELDDKILRNMLEHHFVPVLHGDMVTDDEKGIAVLSGDQITAVLGAKLGANGVGFASAERGVYDEKGDVIPEITPENFGCVKKFIVASKHIDVTGGMLGKVKALLGKNAPHVSCIFDGTHENNIRAFLEEKSPGTKIVNSHAKHKEI